MDSEDELWVKDQSKKVEITPDKVKFFNFAANKLNFVNLLQFEEMMDRLEKSCGQTVLSLVEAKSLLKEDDELIDAVYDYWLTKRLHTVKSAKLAAWLLMPLMFFAAHPTHSSS